jgi:hypothetical protein
MFGFVKSHKMMVACGVLALAAIGGLAGGKTEETASISTTTTVATTTSTIPETTTTITPTTMASPEERFFEVVASAGYVVSNEDRASLLYFAYSACSSMDAGSTYREVALAAISGLDTDTDAPNKIVTAIDAGVITLCTQHIDQMLAAKS